MIILLDIGELEVLELLVRVKQWPGYMRQDKHALCADEDRTGARKVVSFEQGADGGRRPLRAVIPVQRECLLRRISRAGEEVLDMIIEWPVPLVGGRAFGAHGHWRG